MDKNNKVRSTDSIEPSDTVAGLLKAVPASSGIDEGMIDEEYKHRSLLLLAYIATLLEKLGNKSE